MIPARRGKGERWVGAPPFCEGQSEGRAALRYERRARPVVRRAGALHGEGTPALGRYCTLRPSSAHRPSASTRTTFSRTCCISSSGSLRPGHLEGHPGSCRLSTALSAIRAAATAVGGFLFLAVLVYVADEHPAFETRAGTLKAGVVRLYSVVVIVSGLVRVGCARLFCVHS